ncbi:ABC transporter permease [Flintibacter sp. NSJ-23]|uniref:ABC transporter permease n=2 Tax=Flintibacter hominis TaxID=2763048 RepID=A0A8J6J6V7_9FIRM|nr:ABC transporter permease [Flintibacter hominis]
MGTYAVVFTRSFKLAIIATAICVLIGYPLAYFMAKEGPGFQKMAMVIIMLPMWMNFLLRTYAWMSILDNSGILNQFFQAVGIIDLGNLLNGWLNDVCAAINTTVLPALKDLPGIGELLPADFLLDVARPTNMKFFKLLNTQGAVVLGMVYNYLPFMILPIYSVLLKLDNSLLEAARDLGASSARVFRKITLPLSLPGVLSGITMVFVPAVSTFAISKMLGGGTQIMLGDLIEMQFLGNAYNPRLGSAISLVMMVIVVTCMWIMNRFGEGEEQAVTL